MCVDDLNKIIDSSKTASSQRIAANLARALAHEVKNPLAGIKGSAQILSSKVQDEFSDKFLKIIIEETERLNSIVSKILTPPQKPKMEPFNIHSALERVYSLAEAEGTNTIKLIRDYDPSIPDINGDENLFIHAILNIVKNAIQAVDSKDEKASIAISSSFVFISSSSQYLCIICIISQSITNFSGDAMSPPSNHPAAWYTKFVPECTADHKELEVSHIA